MNVSRISLFCAILALAGETAFAQRGQSGEVSAAEAARPVSLITFEQAVAKAAANQPLILQAEAAVQTAEARVGQAKSEYLPEMTAQAGYNYLSPAQYIDVGSASVQTTPGNAYDFHLDAGMLLYDFGKRELKVRLAQTARSSAHTSVDLIRQSVAYETAAIYYGLLFRKEEVEALDEQLTSLNAHLETTKKREAEGTASHLEILATGMRIDRTANRRIDAAAALVKQKIALRQLMGSALDEDFDIAGTFATVQETRDEQTLIAVALSNRPEIRAALQAESAEELGLSLAGLGGYPSISMQGEAGYRNGLLTEDDQNANKLTFNWRLGVLLTMPVFDGFRSDEEKNAAEGKAEAAHQASEEERRIVTAQVLQALQDLSASHAQAINARSQVAQAQESCTMIKMRYDLGAGTNADYLDSLDALYSAKIDDFSVQLREAQSALALREKLGDRIWSEGK
jgi:outer membrane protein TolC